MGWWNTDKFWDYYLEVKNYRERIFATGSQQSIEVKATNFLKGITEEKDGLESKKIAEILLEDITDYGTLALPTMRKIISVEKIKNNENKEKEFKKIINELGGIDYLEKIKKMIKDEKKEIIIAIENQ